MLQTWEDFGSQQKVQDTIWSLCPASGWSLLEQSSASRYCGLWPPFWKIRHSNGWKSCQAGNRRLVGSFTDITHVVVVTYTNTANPGLDFSLCQRLGLHQNVQHTLLHGIGCAGGVAALHSANEFLLGATAQDKPGKALVIACELTSTFCRTELADSVRGRQVNIRPTLFCDGPELLSARLGLVWLWKWLYC